MTQEEIDNYLGELQEPAYKALPFKGVFETATPVDWRTKNVVGPIKDQGSCGSCWAFSSIGGTEGRYAIKYGKQINLSEQQVNDCSWDYGNMGCQGGLAFSGYSYGADFGHQEESTYPYTAKDAACKYDASKVVVGVSRAVEVAANADSLK
jgi:C1A family cysteine protease